MCKELLFSGMHSCRKFPIKSNIAPFRNGTGKVIYCSSVNIIYIYIYIYIYNIQAHMLLNRTPDPGFKGENDMVALQWSHMLSILIRSQGYPFYHIRPKASAMGMVWGEHYRAPAIYNRLHNNNLPVSVVVSDSANTCNNRFDNHWADHPMEYYFLAILPRHHTYTKSHHDDEIG